MAASELNRWRFIWIRQKSDLHSTATIPTTQQHIDDKLFPIMGELFQDTLCHSCRKRGAFSKENGSGIDSVVVPMSRDRLTELTFIAMHSHAILILQRNLRPHRTTTSPLFNEALFTRYFLWHWYLRSSHRRCSVKKGVIRNFAKFTGKHLCQNRFFNKVALGLQLY